ncbi:glycoside hydrolase family 2 TIM barrel-domain containing protein [Deinococcus cellulosilyticus]|uniref:Beta-galactosidase n=1 Tax=Deinococcus cellulosilyticus (strain DSM 18568 / NBRC 106333 / KACC 11606 / 5516J-15) TaxID=1223518 RepID=A0A511MVW9_DEIC1|nr:glycoside hydrolase family 2 TIM barrel-domain containing protein [Deinococcus cellulosilyticus]GEM44408.1 beta-galactosidase [Deinococcus cellulosilyticus NBRC 106333 = KACC 11606]
MTRLEFTINTHWEFLPEDNPTFAKPIYSGPLNQVSVPHTVREVPHHNFSEEEYSFISWYRKSLHIPDKARGQRIHLQFDGVMLAAEVFLDGKKLCEHKGGFTPFTVDLTDHVKVGQEHLLAVRVDSRERTDIPPYGHLVDYMTFGGIYRDVHLRILDPLHIENVFFKTSKVLTETPLAEVEVTVKNPTGLSETVDVEAHLLDASGVQVAATSAQMFVEGEATQTLTFENLQNIQLWDTEHPHLYTLRVRIKGGDTLDTRVGFRESEFRADGFFYLNGRKLILRGMNRHQTYPYIGAAAPKRLQEKDADLVRFDLGCNVVRTSHYPQSPHFLNRCDEIGLLVFTEMQGWQHIGDQAWQDLSLNLLHDLVVRDRNHPSIILWGARVNESPDHTAFYTRTNRLVQDLDPTRQTGGVRCFFGSEQLEDVYTMNDFATKLTKYPAERYLVTEYGGHMFPTKSFDQEPRVVAHALKHADIMNQIGALNISGGIAWCAFDYNTHATFGSGDRICYHGVMDIFRQPKFAAHLYASQQPPEQKQVLFAATYWTRGDVDEGLINPVWIFSNLDRVEVYVSGKFEGEAQRATELYPHLPYPPFKISNISGGWGENFGDLELRGYLNGALVKTHQLAADGIPRKLIFEADDPEIHADGADLTRLSLKITDGYGNALPFAWGPVSLDVEGPAVLVGEHPLILPGGQGAVYLRSTLIPGEVTITARAPGLPTQTVQVKTLDVGLKPVLEAVLNA